MNGLTGRMMVALRYVVTISFLLLQAKVKLLIWSECHQPLGTLIRCIFITNFQSFAYFSLIVTKEAHSGSSIQIIQGLQQAGKSQGSGFVHLVRSTFPKLRLQRDEATVHLAWQPAIH